MLVPNSSELCMTNPIYADFHIHTHLSPCGKPEATAEAMIRRAQEKGLAAIGFADHFTPDPIPGCPFYNHQHLRILTADAHHPDRFARLDLTLEWARRLGFRDEDFLTAQELRERQGRKTA